MVRVDSSSQRMLCVHSASLERDPEAAAGLWLCIKAGRGVVMVAGCRIAGSVVLLRHSCLHSVNGCLATEATLTLVPD